MADFIIRPARFEDTAQAVEVLRRSILELCIADHRNDPDRLKQWLSNKNPESFSAWVADKNGRVFVAEKAGIILAVGSMSISGKVLLNYVSPDFRFAGVSRAMMMALEAEGCKLGLPELILSSTQTAHEFYRRLGYIDIERKMSNFTVDSGYEMKKRL